MLTDYVYDIAPATRGRFGGCENMPEFENTGQSWQNYPLACNHINAINKGAGNIIHEFKLFVILAGCGKPFATSAVELLWLHISRAARLIGKC
jgi:hypothetical protein